MVYPLLAQRPRTSHLSHTNLELLNPIERKGKLRSKFVRGISHYPYPRETVLETPIPEPRSARTTGFQWE